MDRRQWLAATAASAAGFLPTAVAATPKTTSLWEYDFRTAGAFPYANTRVLYAKGGNVYRHTGNSVYLNDGGRIRSSVFCPQMEVWVKQLWEEGVESYAFDIRTSPQERTTFDFRRGLIYWR